MQGTLIFEDLSTVQCCFDIDSVTTYTNPNVLGYNYRYGAPIRQENDIKISIPYSNISYQQIQKYFAKIANNSYSTNYKQTIRFIDYKGTNIISYGFFMTNVSVPTINSSYNQNIEVSGKCDYYEPFYDQVNYKRLLRKKKLERILNE